jgi:hypothetical protein
MDLKSQDGPRPSSHSPHAYAPQILSINHPRPTTASSASFDSANYPSPARAGMSPIAGFNYEESQSRSVGTTNFYDRRPGTADPLIPFTSHTGGGGAGSGFTPDRKSRSPTLKTIHAGDTPYQSPVKGGAGGRKFDDVPAIHPYDQRLGTPEQVDRASSPSEQFQASTSGKDLMLLKI